MQFWSSSSPTQQPTPPPPAQPVAAPPRAHVFSTSHAHVHHAEHFLGVVECVMGRPAAEFRLSLNSVEDQAADSVLVSVASVVHMAKIMATFTALQTTYASTEAVPIVLAYEVGKAERAMRPGDVVIVLTSIDSVHRALGDRVTCIDISRHRERIYTRDRQLR